MVGQKLTDEETAHGDGILKVQWKKMGRGLAACGGSRTDLNVVRHLDVAEDETVRRALGDWRGRTRQRVGAVMALWTDAAAYSGGRRRSWRTWRLAR